MHHPRRLRERTSGADNRSAHTRAAQAAARVADLVLLPCRPSVLDVEAVADTAARVRAITKAPVVVLLTACAPRGQDAD